MRTAKEPKEMNKHITPESLKRSFQKDAFARHVGIELLEVGVGYAKASLRIEDRHLNGLKIPHGAAVFSLADLAFAAASNSHGQPAVAINASISYIKAAIGPVIYAEAKEVSANPKIASYEIHITEESGDVVAVFHGLVYKKSMKTDFFDNP
jgi:acyl-CoA thioesterase